MAILSNINDKFAVDSTGAIQFNGQAGTSGYILKSNGNAAPTWVAASTVIGGPYLPLSGGTLTGATATASGISFTVGGVLTVNTASSNIFTLNRTTSAGGYMKFQNNGTDKFYIGSRGTISGSGGAGYDIYTVSGNDIRLFPGTLLALTLDTSANATFKGNIKAEGTRTISAQFDSQHFIRLESNSSGGVLKGTDGGVTTILARSYGDSYFNGGNFGIGTTSPGHKLNVVAANNTTAVGIDFPSAHYDFSANSTSGYTTSFHMDNTGTYIGSNSAGRALIFQTNSTDRLYINGNTGNVGIGTTSPGNLLDVAGDTDINGQLFVTHDANYVAKIKQTATSMSNGAYTFEIDSTSHTSNMSAAGAMSVDVNSGRAFTINGQGKVGINETSPRTKLEVKVDTSSRNTITRVLTLNANGNAIQPYDGFGTGVIFEGFDYAGGGGTSTSRDYAYIDSIMETSGSTPVDFTSKLVFATNSGGSSTTTPTTKMVISGSGNVGIGTGSPNATLHVNGGVHFGTDSAVINPTNGQVLIETVAGGTPRLQMYVYGSSVFDIHSDGTTANIGWSSGASREVNFQNTGAGDIKVGIATGAPTQPLDVSGYSICDKQLQRDNTLQTIVYTPRVLNIGYRGANGTYTFNPVSLFGSAPQGGQCVLQVTGWRAALNNGIIHWVDNGSNTNIGAGQVYYTQTAYKAGGQTGSNTISVSNSSGTNNITIAFTGWHTNSHGWNCKLISYQA